MTERRTDGGKSHNWLSERKLAKEKDRLSAHDNRKRRGGDSNPRYRQYPYDGLANRYPENTSIDNTKTCETTKEQLTPQLTPNSRKHPEIDTQNLPPDLAEIVTKWPTLQEHIKAAIKALVVTAQEQQ